MVPGSSRPHPAPVAPAAPAAGWVRSVAEPSGARAGVRAGFTDRRGGVSAAPWEGLNLGGGVGDDPEAVRSNRHLVADAVGVGDDHLLFMEQCHSTTVVQVDGPWVGPAPRCDALVTTRRDLALAALVADCTPVLLHDAAAGVVAAVHAGRHGMVDGIVGAAVAALRDLGATAPAALVGPSICGRCYEVPADLREQAARRSPVSSTLSWTGTPAVDVAAGVVQQLVEAGVEVSWVPGCSREDPLLYSYRRDGATGRYAAVVRLVPPAGTPSGLAP